MSDQNATLVRRVIDDVWNNHNLKLTDELFTPDYRSHDPSTPDLGTGPNAMRALVQTYSTAFPDLRFTISDLFSINDRVVLRWTVNGTNKGDLLGIPPTGKKVTVTGISIYRITNNKIAESFTNWDALGLFQQLGIVSKTVAKAA